MTTFADYFHPTSRWQSAFELTVGIPLGLAAIALILTIGIITISIAIPACLVAAPFHGRFFSFA